ncbi:MAG: acetoacetate--CoA ligase [Pseudomonadota bacterium]
MTRSAVGAAKRQRETIWLWEQSLVSASESASEQSDKKPVEFGQLLWAPSESFAASSNIAEFMTWLAKHRGLEFSDYHALWSWSVTDLASFWESIWEFFEVRSEGPYLRVVDSEDMRPGVRWFEGSRLNFAEHVLRGSREGTAIWHLSETRPLQQVSWAELLTQVRTVGGQLRALGVKPGDCVASILPNLPETVVAMLATISIGGLWTNAAPEFGISTLKDRFSQLRPRVLLAADGYQFGGKTFDKRGELAELLRELPDVETLVFLPYLNADAQPEAAPVKVVAWGELVGARDPGEGFRFTQVGYDHPLWAVFSSGTTGLPKAIVHNHVGVLLEMYKFMALHLDLRQGDVAFFYTTTGWVMFNLVVGMLLTGSAIVLYDGSPVYPGPQRLWEMASASKTTLFGASPGYVKVLNDLGVVPKDHYDLSALRSVLVGGAPSTPETFSWFYSAVKEDLWVTSQSGGTEIASGFVVGCPLLPVYAGEIQTRALGMAVEAFDATGVPVVGGEGELVCRKPFPSMPLYFVNDDDHARYRAAYFEDIPGVWRHGDYFELNERGGCYIYGRSDSTLNRNGVRIGTAEVYRVVEALDEVEDSLIVCAPDSSGVDRLPLFLQLRAGADLDDRLVEKVTSALKQKCSARHVPDNVIQVDEIPYTLTGKKLEVPVQRLLSGKPLEEAASTASMRNPAAIEVFAELAKTGLWLSLATPVDD